MIVEDDRESREAIHAIVELHGHRVIALDGGTAALRYLETNEPPALILLDLGLPGMNGSRLVTELRARPALAAIPVVLVSGEPDLPERARELAVAGHLQKPFDVRELLSTLRLAGAPQAVPRPMVATPRDSRQTLRGLRVLVVDDDSLILEAMTILLEREGAEAWTAGSAEAAWKRLERDLPDVLVSDLAIGAAGGHGLIRQVREDARTRGLYAIAITGHVLVEDRQRSIAAGFDHYLPKPVDIDELRALLADRTPRRDSSSGIVTR
jgi:CheY-like chemotaxis protein